MNKDKLARAALRIAKELGEYEEWADPAGILEDLADILREAGVPDPGAGANISYWLHMSIDGALASATEAPAQQQPTRSVTLNIDASEASAETIAAIFDRLKWLMQIPASTDLTAARAVLEPDGGVQFLRSADL